MGRCFFFATLIYASGHPGLDGYRPEAFDRPLQGFHRDVNQVARDGHRMLTTLDDARGVRYLKGYIDYMDTQLRGS